VPGVDTKDEDEEEEVDDGEDIEYEEQIEMSVPVIFAIYSRYH